MDKFKTLESYETTFGTIFIAARPYCKGCRDFVPEAHLSWVNGVNGTNVRYDEYHAPIYDGTVIRCEKEYMCQHLREMLKKRLGISAEEESKTEGE